MLLVVCFSSSCTPENVRREQELRAAAETAVRNKLRDPQSAVFSDVEVRLENGSVCGKVNGKNGFGGYAGAEFFAFYQGMAAVGSDDDQLLPLMRKCTEAAEEAARAASG